jgi:hypothetical protein
MESTRRSRELEQFLGDAMDVNGKRNATKAYESDPKFLFVQHHHALVPLGSSDSNKPPRENEGASQTRAGGVKV